MIFTVNYLKFLITYYRLNSIKKKDAALTEKHGKFTRSDFYGIFGPPVLASETSNTSVY